MSPNLCNCYCCIIATGKHHSIKKLLKSILFSWKDICRGTWHIFSPFNNLNDSFLIIYFELLTDHQYCVKCHYFSQTRNLCIFFKGFSRDYLILRIFQNYKTLRLNFLCFINFNCNQRSTRVFIQIRKDNLREILWIFYCFIIFLWNKASFAKDWQFLRQIHIVFFFRF